MEYNNSQIEPECKLYRNLTIDNSKIGSGCVIADDTTILNSEIQKKYALREEIFYKM